MANSMISQLGCSSSHLTSNLEPSLRRKEMCENVDEHFQNGVSVMRTG
jgi:hypothetical protein